VSWLGMGMAIHSVDPTATGLKIWEEWSAQCREKYGKKCTCREKWPSFGKYTGRKIGLGSLIVWARANGWAGPTSPATEGPNEAPDDPHRLSRLYIKEKCTHPDGSTLYSYLEETIRWGPPYRMVREKEHRAEVTAVVKAEMDRINTIELNRSAVDSITERQNPQHPWIAFC
jgi:Primase C terminal 2 (PriCT-2)